MSSHTPDQAPRSSDPHLSDGQLSSAQSATPEAISPQGVARAQQDAPTNFRADGGWAGDHAHAADVTQTSFHSASEEIPAYWREGEASYGYTSDGLHPLAGAPLVDPDSTTQARRTSDGRWIVIACAVVALLISAMGGAWFARSLSGSATPAPNSSSVVASSGSSTGESSSAAPSATSVAGSTPVSSSSSTPSASTTLSSSGSSAEATAAFPAGYSRGCGTDKDKTGQGVVGQTAPDVRIKDGSLSSCGVVDNVRSQVLSVIATEPGAQTFNFWARSPRKVDVAYPTECTRADHLTHCTFGKNGDMYVRD